MEAYKIQPKRLVSKPMNNNIKKSPKICRVNINNDLKFKSEMSEYTNKDSKSQKGKRTFRNKSEAFDKNSSIVSKDKPYSISSERKKSVKTERVRTKASKDKSETSLKTYIIQSKISHIKSSKFLSKPHERASKNYTTYLSKGLKGSTYGLTSRGINYTKPNSVIENSRNKKSVSKKNSFIKGKNLASKKHSPYDRSSNSKVSLDNQSPRDNLLYNSLMSGMRNMSPVIDRKILIDLRSHNVAKTNNSTKKNNSKSKRKIQKKDTGLNAYDSK
jgi:hypothetical protein